MYHNFLPWMLRDGLWPCDSCRHLCLSRIVRSVKSDIHCVWGRLAYPLEAGDLVPLETYTLPRNTNICYVIYHSYKSVLYKGIIVIIGLVCWSLTSLCHSNGHIETMPTWEINPFTALTRIWSQFLRTQWSTSNHQRVDTTTPQTAEPSGLAIVIIGGGRALS